MSFVVGSDGPPFEKASVVVLPVPYERTVSYGRGTAHGPRAILEASMQVELYDDWLGSCPADAGIWTDPPLAIDADDPRDAVQRIETRWRELLEAGKWVVMLGGEHSITPGGVAAVAAHHPDLTVVQLDAHADLRESYENDPGSHACAMARCLEHAAVRAIGIRSYSPGEASRIREGIPGYRVLPAWEMDAPGAMESILDGLDGKPVYLTLDVDYFDPSIVPATGTPEPGGGRWWPTQSFLRALFSRTRVVGADVVELAPLPGLPHPDFTVARQVYRLIGLWAEALKRRT